MSNIAGKAYAMNVVTPVSHMSRWWNAICCRLAHLPLLSKRFDGLKTLSLVHYARWTILAPDQFPRLSDDQPKEKLAYSYMLFFSNYNSSWDQYVDSFHMSIPRGLNFMWRRNIGYPGAVPLQPFHRYILHNQIWTDHFYNAYPLASANDVKSALSLRQSLVEFNNRSQSLTASEFKKQYDAFLFDVQPFLGRMAAAPVVSIAHRAVQERRRLNTLNQKVNHRESGVSPLAVPADTSETPV